MGIPFPSLHNKIFIIIATSSAWIVQPSLEVSICETKYLFLTFMNKNLNTQGALEEQGCFPSRQEIALSVIVP